MRGAGAALGKPLGTALAGVLAVGPLGVLAGCGSTPSRQVAAASTTPAGSTCAGSSAPTVLPGVPGALPLPTGGTLLTDVTQPNGLRIVRFSTTQSLRQGVLFILDRYPKAGFVLGRGDAEATEADAPFSDPSGSLRGALRLTSSAACATTWLLAYAQSGAGQSGPPIPTYTPTSGPTALPFS